MTLVFRNLAIGFAVGFGIGAGGCYLYLSHIRGPLKPAEGGMPQTDMLRFNKGYVAAVDFRTRNAKWVLEHISKESVNGDADRTKSDFYEDKGIEPRFRARLDDYKNSGYDRGHMAPAADHKASQAEMDETFSLSNISPQVGKGFNRDYWARFEKFVKDLTKKVDDVYVLTGPLWMPTTNSEGKWAAQYPFIGEPPSLVAVPTHFYKVVVVDGRKGGSDNRVGVGAFVMPNAPIAPAMPLTAYVVPLESLEAVAGTKFFPNFINDARRKALDNAALAWRTQGLQQMKAFDRVSLLEDTKVLLAPAQLASAASTKSQGSLPAPKTVGGQGAVHLCEVTACKLPAQEFWQANKQGAAGGAAAAVGGAAAAGALPR